MYNKSQRAQYQRRFLKETFGSKRTSTTLLAMRSQMMNKLRKDQGYLAGDTPTLSIPPAPRQSNEHSLRLAGVDCKTEETAMKII
jgi:hypothetical protein